MSKEQLGEKTEQATPRKLEEALKKGQIARSAEVQTLFVLGGGLLALTFAGSEIWRQLALAVSGTLGHLHEFNPTASAMQSYSIGAALLLAKCVGSRGGDCNGGRITGRRYSKPLSNSVGSAFDQLGTRESYQRI